MPSRRHPLSGAMYHLLDAAPDAEEGTGRVVEVSKDGRSGRFRADGSWIDGELTHADPHLCLWLAGPQLPVRAARTAGEGAGRR